VAAVILLAASVVALSACDGLFPWAAKDCASHGGVAHVRMIGSTGVWKAKCSDGAVFYK
jgi:hypothetical protein